MLKISFKIIENEQKNVKENFNKLTFCTEDIHAGVQQEFCAKHYLVIAKTLFKNLRR